MADQTQTSFDDKPIVVTPVSIEAAGRCTAAFAQGSPVEAPCVNLGVWNVKHPDYTASSVCDLHVGIEVLTFREIARAESCRKDFDKVIPF